MPVDAIAGVSTAVLVGRYAAGIINEVRRVAVTYRRVTSNRENALDALLKDVGMVQRIATAKEEEDKFQGVGQELRLLQIQELLYDVNDFVLRLWEPGKFGRILALFGRDYRPEDVERMKHFRERLKFLLDFKPEDHGGDAGPHPPASYAPESELICIAKPKADVIRLLSLDPSADLPPLRVITILGRRGVGKTALARAVHDDCHASCQYDIVAWVAASDCRDSKVLLDKVLQSVKAEAEAQRVKAEAEAQRVKAKAEAQRVKEEAEAQRVNVEAKADPSDTEADSSDAEPDHSDAEPDPSDADLHSILSDKRYLVIIDDLQGADLWNGIKTNFPENHKGDRIIVTTYCKGVASFCSTGRYMYTIRGLSNNDSKKLFWDKLDLNRSDALEMGLQKMFSTCEGLPLAIISVANLFLEQGKINLTVKDCEEVSLGMLLASDHGTRSFREMRRITACCYNSLPDYAHRMCLLSMSMFPKGYRIEKKSLIREVVAGGLVVGGRLRVEKESLASACLNELINQGIVEPAAVGVNFEAKRLQVDGIIQDFLIHKSAYKNFSTLINDGDVSPSIETSYPVRRMSIHGSTSESESAIEGFELSCIRWLRICSPKILVDLKSCELLRVLDLEGSKGIDVLVMKNICNLQFLKYLGLRRTDVDRIPKRVAKLRALETLDIRETKVQVLPIQVFELPMIACLCGQFELPHSFKKSKSSMEHLNCLAGVVVDKDWLGFDQIMRKAGKHFKKLKISCKCPPPEGTTIFRDRLQTLITSLDHLTVESAYLCNQVIDLFAPQSTRTIKLRGALDCLPEPAVLATLEKLQELHLVGTGLNCEALSVLQALRHLMYLKLSEPAGFMGDSSFVCESDGFRSLKRLCFEAPSLPSVRILPGGLQNLTYLDLFCPQQVASFIGFEHLSSLNEVTLHRVVEKTVVRMWNKASDRHQNKPRVKLQFT